MSEPINLEPIKRRLNPGYSVIFNQHVVADLVDEVERLRAALVHVAEALDGQPEYHDQGMGCGLEDRRITDRYEAMAHGWECAMERVYGEHINAALEIARAAASSI